MAIIPRSDTLFGTPREWAVDLAIAAAIGAFLGVIGPFGSFNGGPIGLRVFFWVANFWIGFAILSVVVRVSLRLGARFDVPVWFCLPVGVALGAVPLGYAIAVFAALVWPGAHHHVAGLAAWYGETLVISEPAAFAYYFLIPRDRGHRALGPRARRQAEPPPPLSVSAPSAGFLDRLPPKLGRDLLCLQMEDHYVRAHTARGSDLVLTPLKQAMAELETVEGLQVHRSWWVARAAVASCRAEGRNLRLTLSNGLVVPVARTSVSRLRAAGWLDEG